MAAGFAAGSDLAGTSGAGIARSFPEAEISDRRKHRPIRIPWMLESGILAGMMVSSARAASTSSQDWKRGLRERRAHAEFVDPHRLALQAGTVSLATSNLYTRAVLPPAILACSSSGTPARMSARIFRDWGNVDSLCG